MCIRDSPSTFHNGNKIHPLVGTDLMPAIKGKVSSIHEYMYWEHQGNRAVRWKNWKAVWDQEGKVWELYDIGKDRVEACDLSAVHPDILKQMCIRDRICIRYEVSRISKLYSDRKRQ